MNKAICIGAILVGMLVVGMGFMPPRHDSDFEVQKFATLPVQSGGRVLPLDSVAINSLRVIGGKGSVRLPEGGRLSAIAWFLEVALRPESSDAIPSFRIDNAEVLGLFGWQQEDRKFFSYNELLPHIHAIEREYQIASAVESAQRTVYQGQIVKLYNALFLYNQLTRSFVSSPTGIPSMEYLNWQNTIAAAFAAVRQMEDGQAQPNDQALAHFSAYLENWRNSPASGSSLRSRASTATITISGRTSAKLFSKHRTPAP
jgi:hypothetical protein